MTSATIIGQSVRHYWRTHLGVVLGAALGALVLTGALLVGDSVNATLHRQALLRVGKVQSVLVGGDRFFRSALGDEVGAAPVLMALGSVARADAKARVNQAQVLGVTEGFWKLGPEGAHLPAAKGAQAILNSRLAEQLSVKSGDTLVVRIEKPSAFSKDAPLSGSDDETVALRVQVAGIASATDFGNFSLQANQAAPLTIFLPLNFLQSRLETGAGANMLVDGQRTVDQLRTAVAQHWQPADASLQIRALAHGAGVELRTSRVFLDAPVERAAPPGVNVLTYLVNEIRAGDKATPYSMATAVDAKAAGLLPASLGEHEAAISQWEADDLGVGVGAKITLTYFVMGERRQLAEKSAAFTVRAVIPMNQPGFDSSWMPDFPGLSDKKNCRDWEPGFAMDLTKIRDKDEKYWDEKRGTPKVIINFGEGQKLWANRWGDMTAIRYADKTADQIAAALHAKLAPEDLGMSFIALRDQALAATNVPVDFGQLFLGFSFFLLIAAAVLTGLLFVFSLEQRNEEAGLLLALGWRTRQVRRLLLSEGAVLAVAGSLIGTLGAILYTQLVLHGLATVWHQAVGAVEFQFSATPLSLATGFASSVLIALLAMWLASRRQLRHSARELLSSSGSFEMAAPARQGRWPWSLIIGYASVAGAAAIVGTAGHGASSDTFFSAGGLLLIGGIALGLAWLKKMAGSESAELSLAQLGMRNTTRRRGRSMATIAVLASGVFMVVAVDAFRETPGETALRSSGTGGFALIGESSLPIYEDLNTPKGREVFALKEKELTGVAFVPMRVRQGDDASCLNLNRALQPRLLGVKPSDLASRGAFRFSAQEKGAASPPSWELLARPSSDGSIPAVVDETTLEWALQKSLGDTLDYVDERGQTFKVRLAATLSGSILQGVVLIDEQRFIEKFPSQGGYRYFLIDAPADRVQQAAQELSRGLADRGLEITPASRRLADFQAVENTYLSIFQALGGLGLLLGSAGLAIVVARNVLERRGEFGLLTAVGFRHRQLRQLVFIEHRWLIAGGLVLGIVSAIVAVWPNLQNKASGFPWLEMTALIGALALGAVFWTWLASRLALREDQIAALRNE